MTNMLGGDARSIEFERKGIRGGYRVGRRQRRRLRAGWISYLRYRRDRATLPRGTASMGTPVQRRVGHRVLDAGVDGQLSVEVDEGHDAGQDRAADHAQSHTLMPASLGFLGQDQQGTACHEIEPGGIDHDRIRRRRSRGGLAQYSAPRRQCVGVDFATSMENDRATAMFDGGVQSEASILRLIGWWVQGAGLTVQCCAHTGTRFVSRVSRSTLGPTLHPQDRPVFLY